MGLIMFLVVGGITGWVASIVMKTNAQMGLIANILVGVVGAGIGGWLAGILHVGGGGLFGWIFAIAGAALLIAILKALGVFK